ncbi:hypothetical protein PG985_001634 [Apiospora marii]|uniref:uncharacterized protein n=1 Tax=Apiospora marii TaxID=335849 RepID=UPI0031329678
MQQSPGAVPTLPLAQGLLLARGPPPPPTIAEVRAFLQSLLPVRQGDVAFDYHTPRSRFFDPGTARPAHVVLSITPTPGFYDALAEAAAVASASPSSPRSTTTPLAFLHRPWELDRRRVPHGATVVASHKAFDEVLTVGNNAALAAGLGMVLDKAGAIQGYKGDPDRTIGIVGPLDTARDRATLRAQLETEFGSFEGAFGFEDDNGAEEADNKEVAPSGEKDHVIRCVAIMNAFHPEEVDQVAALAAGMGLAPSLEDCQGVLYLTGAVRAPGLAAARGKGMAVVCVGHRTCEEWGIRHLGRLLRERWPGLQVRAVLEAEEPMVLVKKGKGGGGKAQSAGQGVVLGRDVEKEIDNEG